MTKLFHLVVLLPVFLFASALHGQSSQPPVPSAGKESSKNRNAQSQSKQAYPCPPLQGTQASPLWVNVIKAGADKPEAKPNQDKSENGSAQKGRVDPNWLIAIFTVVLAFVAAIQAGFFLWQLRMMKASLEDSKKAVEAAGKAAESAQRSADIASDTDRAWVITNADFSSDWPDIAGNSAPVKSQMILQLKNAGKSPAEMQRMRTVTHLVSKDWPLPESPTYGESEDWDVESSGGEIIGPGDKIPVFCSVKWHDHLSDFQIAQIRNGSLNLFCYGLIEYKDNSGKQRLTQFGYFFYARTGDTDHRPEGMYRLSNRGYNYTT